MNKLPLHYVIHLVVRNYEEHKLDMEWTMDDSWVHVTEQLDIGYDMTEKQYTKWINMCREINGNMV